jgi:toxin ParE1/3/4
MHKVKIIDIKSCEINDVFIKIVNTPEIGRTRNELKKGLYSMPIGMHIIFYRILTDHVRIVRVLYGSRDLPRNF